MNEYLPLLAKLNSTLNDIALTKINVEPFKDALYSFALFGMTQQQKSMLEQHIGTLLQIMVVALLGWSLNTSVALRTEVSVLQTQMSALQTTLAQGANDRYRGTDAARDFSATWDSINRLSNRVSAAEEAIQKHRAETSGLIANGKYTK